MTPSAFIGSLAIWAVAICLGIGLSEPRDALTGIVSVGAWLVAVIVVLACVIYLYLRIEQTISNFRRTRRADRCGGYVNDYRPHWERLP